jgi:hypothetical protein
VHEGSFKVVEPLFTSVWLAQSDAKLLPISTKPVFAASIVLAVAPYVGHVNLSVSWSVVIIPELTESNMGASMEDPSDTL